MYAEEAPLPLTHAHTLYVVTHTKPGSISHQCGSSTSNINKPYAGDVVCTYGAVGSGVAANQCIPNQATALRCILGCQLSASVEELASFRVVVAHSKTAGEEQV